jgi:predicted ATPase
MELARENRFSLLSANASIVLGRVMVEEGRPEEGLAEIQRALDAVGETGLKSRVGVVGLSLLAEAYEIEQQTEKGLAALAKAWAIIGTDSDHFIKAELIRLRGEFLLGQAIPACGDAEACFRRAIEISRLQGGKSLELRAVTSLSRLLHRQGKDSEARQMLAELYSWFTEGFETADLKEAKASLDELS